jgi:hypothetical protein
MTITNGTTQELTGTEKKHLKFCKLYLGVSRRASNTACRGELVKFPLLISIKKNIINYIKYILKLPDKTGSILYRLYLSTGLHKNNKKSYYGNAMWRVLNQKRAQRTKGLVWVLKG